MTNPPAHTLIVPDTETRYFAVRSAISEIFLLKKAALPLGF